MTEDIHKNSKTEQNGPAGGEEDDSLVRKLDALYSQSEAIKMVSMQYFLEAEKSRGMENDGAAMKLSQMALKAIELQLRIVSESKRHDRTENPPLPEDVWETMLELPGVGPLLRRDRIKDELVKRLKEKARME